MLQELKHSLVSRKLKFQTAEHQQNDCSSGGITVDGLGVPEGSSSMTKTQVRCQVVIKQAFEKTHARQWQDWHRRKKF